MMDSKSSCSNIPVQTPSGVADIPGIKEVTGAIPLVRDGITIAKVTRAALALTLPAYDSVGLSLYLVMDFKDPIRVDDWTGKKNKILKTVGAIRHNTTYTIEGELKNFEIVHQEFYRVPDVDEIESVINAIGDDDFQNLDVGFLWVKRVNIFATPYDVARDSYSKAIARLTKYQEDFITDLDLKKSFVGVRLDFKKTDTRKIFSRNLSKKIKSKNIENTDYRIEEYENTIKITCLRLSISDNFFDIIADELYIRKWRFGYEYITDPIRNK